MRRILNAKLRLWHLLLTLVIVSGAVGATAIAGGESPTDHVSLGGVPKTGSVPLNFWKQGTPRMVASYRTNAIAVPDAPTEVNVLNGNFTVPAGRRADVIVWFTANASATGTTGWCYGEFRLDGMSGTVLSPGEYWPVDAGVYGSGYYPVFTMMGFKKGIGPGSHTIFTTMDEAGGDVECWLYQRSLVILASIHN